MIEVLKISSICKTSIRLSNSAVKVIKPSSSNSQFNDWDILFSIYTETDLVRPIFLINLKIVAFFKNGIF